MSKKLSDEELAARLKKGRESAPSLKETISQDILEGG